MNKKIVNRSSLKRPRVNISSPMVVCSHANKSKFLFSPPPTASNYEVMKHCDYDSGVSLKSTSLVEEDGVFERDYEVIKPLTNQISRRKKKQTSEKKQMWADEVVLDFSSDKMDNRSSNIRKAYIATKYMPCYTILKPTRSKKGPTRKFTPRKVVVSSVRRISNDHERPFVVLSSCHNSEDFLVSRNDVHRSRDNRKRLIKTSGGCLDYNTHLSMMHDKFQNNFSLADVPTYLNSNVHRLHGLFLW